MVEKLGKIENLVEKVEIKISINHSSDISNTHSRKEKCEQAPIKIGPGGDNNENEKENDENIKNKNFKVFILFRKSLESFNSHLLGDHLSRRKFIQSRIIGKKQPKNCFNFLL